MTVRPHGDHRPRPAAESAILRVLVIKAIGGAFLGDHDASPMEIDRSRRAGLQG